jgi:hypothetical protein
LPITLVRFYIKERKEGKERILMKEKKEKKEK